MGTKTSQLQIRISPAQKAALKGLADEAGLSVSAYVLSKALPSVKLDLQRRIEDLQGSPDRAAALAQLTAHLRGLSEPHFREAVAGSAPEHLPALLRNQVAATVEREAGLRGLDPPSWTATVAPLERPHFDWDLRSLRPHLMRVTPPAFKRRRVFVAVDRDASMDAVSGVSGGTVSERGMTGAPGRSIEPRPHGARGLWDLLDEAMAAEEIVAELCVVGGAVMRLAFAARPGTRRPRALFAPQDGVDRAAAAAAERRGLPAEWLSGAVRDFVGTSTDSQVVYEGARLRVFSAPPEYVLAMKCASLTFVPAPSAEADIRYLLRFLEIRSVDRVMHLLDDYLNPRQRPSDLEERLDAMLR